MSLSRAWSFYVGFILIFAGFYLCAPTAPMHHCRLRMDTPLMAHPGSWVNLSLGLQDGLARFGRYDICAVWI
jgi:hypothetical protein